MTGISILVQTGIQIDAFVNPFTVAAGFLLLCSTALAGVTYTASNLRGGFDGGSVRQAIDMVIRTECSNR